MSGLQLRTGLTASVSSGNGGGYTPLLPNAAVPAASGTVAQQAYGITGSGSSIGGTARPAIGSVGVGVLAIVGLVYLWWSLPR